MTPESVRREVDASLGRLGVERIDLFQVHWPATGTSLEYTGDGGTEDAGVATPLEEYWQEMVELRTEGKVRAIGLSNHDLAQLQAASKIARVESFQPPFSAINRSGATEIAWCAQNDTGVIVYSPMQSGLLTGAFTPQRVDELPPNDWRRGHIDFTRNLRNNLGLVDAMRPVARRHGTTLGAVAVAWVLVWPGVTGAIVGARRPGQIDDWLPGATLELDPADLDEIARATTASGVGEGPVRPLLSPDRM
jgi:aryl-alcohol dehydrogenase-like predicted oxidoreductase